MDGHGDGRAAGRAAFDAYWTSRGKGPWEDPLTVDFAAGVIDSLVDRWSSLGLAAEALEGGRSKAGEKHVEPLDALLELLQNADDQQAHSATMVLRGNKLLFAHDGRRIRLPDVPAIVMPYLSTKRSDSATLGRFGIGLKTLGALGDHLSVHGPPYHFAAGRGGPERAEPHAGIPGIYDPAGKHTLFVLRLRPGSLDGKSLRDWADSLGSAGIVFLRSLKSLDVRTQDASITIKARRKPHRTWPNAEDSTEVRVERVIGGGGWSVYTTTLTPPVELVPKDKARSEVVTIGVAISNVADGGRICVGLPIERRATMPLSLNAPFDPDDARRDLLHTDWNAWLFDRLSELVRRVVQIRYEEDPPTVWRAVPLPTERKTGHAWLDEQLAKVASAAIGALRELTFQPPDIEEGDCTFSKATVEPAWLSRFITPDLLTVKRTGVVPLHVRDSAGRWRRVLRGAKLGSSLSVPETLQATHESELVADRTPRWWAELVAAVLEHDDEGSLDDCPVLVLDDESRVSPAEVDGGLILTRSATSAPVPVLARLHDDFLQAPDAGAILEWLSRTSRLAEAPDDGRLLDAIASWAGDPLLLDDEAIAWLHRALWSLDETERPAVGRRVGARVTVSGFSYEAGERRERQVVPGASYLPATITHQADSFAKAAGRVEGLDWIAPRYERILQGSRELGRGAALATLRLLGARTTPRLTSRPRWNRYSGGAAASHLSASPGFLQAQAMAGLSRRPEALLNDRTCPDLQLVAEDIAADDDDEARSSRAGALFATLCREWENEYAGHLSVPAADGHYGWNRLGKVPATWRSQLADVAWMSSAEGRAAPRELALRTKSLEMAHGDSMTFAVDVDASESRAEVVGQALGMTTRPSASGLVDELKSLRDRSQQFTAEAVGARARQLTGALALLCPEVDDDPIDLTDEVDDLTVRQLRGMFGIARDRAGLIYAENRWWPPTAAVVGTSAFGRFRARVPDAPPLTRLWRVLGISGGTLDVCRSVLDEMAQAPLVDEDVGTHIAVLRLLVELVEDPEAEAAPLHDAPVWCGSGWMDQRPILAARDPIIAEALRIDHRVWDPRCDLDTVASLIGPLAITEVRASDLSLPDIAETSRREGELYVERYRLAIQHYRELCAKDAPEIYGALEGLWGRMAEASVIVTPDLTVTAHVGVRSMDIPVDTFASRRLGILAVRDPAFFESRDLGRSLAAAWLSGEDGSYPDQVKAALLWREAWQLAHEGIRLSGLALPDSSVPDDLVDLEATLSERELPPPKGRAEPSGAGPGSTAPIVVELKTADSVRPSGSAVVEGELERGDGRDTRGGGAPRLRGRDEVEGSGGEKPTKPRAPRAPNRDPEDAAMDLLKVALRSDTLRDFRNQRGIGADAVDGMLGFIEMKHARGELPARVSLTAAEFKRAEELRDKYVLAVVAGLERGTKSVVRLYPDPFGRLRVEAPSGVTLGGLREASCLEITLEDVD